MIFQWRLLEYFAVSVLLLLIGLEESTSFLVGPVCHSSPQSCWSRVHYPRRSTTTRTSELVVLADSSSKTFIDWVKEEPIDSIVSKEDAFLIVSELLSNESLLTSGEEKYNKYWDSLEKRLRTEARTVHEILGKETSDKILESFQSLGGYDRDAVRAFLGSEAINKLFATILYDGIFEFFQKIDVFGNIINSLPIIGPIRKQIITETKKTLDRSLGPLVQSFLRTYTKIAVLQASEYILSPENTKSFGKANVKLVSNLLERPINTLIPSSETTNKLKVDSYQYLRTMDLEAVDRVLDFVYEIVGDKSISSVINTDKILDASPTLRKTIDNFWEKANTAINK